MNKVVVHHLRFLFLFFFLSPAAITIKMALAVATSSSLLEAILVLTLNFTKLQVRAQIGIYVKCRVNRLKLEVT